MDFFDNRNIAPLHYAAGANRIDIIDLLVTAGCDVDVHDPDDPWSPLDTAARMGKAEAAKELLRLAQDDVERQWRVYSNRAAMPGRSDTPGIAPVNAESVARETPRNGD